MNKGIGANANPNFSSGHVILRSGENKFIGWNEINILKERRIFKNIKDKSHM